MKRPRHGFTLIELMVVIGIILILVAIVVIVVLSVVGAQTNNVFSNVGKGLGT